MNNQLEVLDPALLDWQEQKRQDYLKQNQKENPEIIFIGDSITDFFPIKKLIKTDVSISNRGIAGYISDSILDYYPIHIFGENLKQVFLMIGTNDIGMGIENGEIVENVSQLIKKVQSDYPSVKMTILSVLPVNEGADYAARVKLRRNETIRALNSAYLELIKDFENVDYLDLSSVLEGTNGQLMPKATSDGLHLTTLGYEKICEVLNRYLNNS